MPHQLRGRRDILRRGERAAHFESRKKRRRRKKSTRNEVRAGGEEA